MTPERWQLVDRLLEQALEQEAERRGVFLDEAYKGDAALRQEVKSLLEAHERPRLHSIVRTRPSFRPLSLSSKASCRDGRAERQKREQA